MLKFFLSAPRGMLLASLLTLFAVLLPGSLRAEDISPQFYKVLQTHGLTPPAFWTDRTIVVDARIGVRLAFGEAAAFSVEESGTRSPSQLSHLADQILQRSFADPALGNSLGRAVAQASDSDLPTALELSAMELRLSSESYYPVAVAHFLDTHARNGLPVDKLPDASFLALPPPPTFEIMAKPGNAPADLWWNHQRAVAMGDFAAARTSLDTFKMAVHSPKEKSYSALIPQAEARLLRWQSGQAHSSPEEATRLQGMLDFYRNNPLQGDQKTLIAAWENVSIPAIVQRANLAADLFGAASPEYADLVLYLIQVRGHGGLGLRISDLNVAWRNSEVIYSTYRTALLQLACSDAADWKDDQQAGEALFAMAIAANNIARTDLAPSAAPFFRSALRNALQITGKSAKNHSVTQEQPTLLKALLNIDIAGSDRQTFEADASEYLKNTSNLNAKAALYECQMEAYLETWPDKAAFLDAARNSLRDLPFASPAYAVTYNIRHATRIWPDHPWKAEVATLKMSLPRTQPGAQRSAISPILDELDSKL